MICVIWESKSNYKVHLQYFWQFQKMVLSSNSTETARKFIKNSASQTFVRTVENCLGPGASTKTHISPLLSLLLPLVLDFQWHYIVV